MRAQSILLSTEVPKGEKSHGAVTAGRLDPAAYSEVAEGLTC